MIHKNLVNGILRLKGWTHTGTGLVVAVWKHRSWSTEQFSDRIESIRSKWHRKVSILMEVEPLGVRNTMWMWWLDPKG